MEVLPTPLLPTVDEVLIPVDKVDKIDKKVKNLNLQEKINVIKMVTEEKKSIKEVIAHFKCGKTQIYNIIKKKDKIIEKYLSSSKNDLAKFKERDAKYKELNSIVFEWFSAARAMNIPISGPILQQKAKEMAAIIKLDGFTASNGWLQSFRKRHNITFSVTRGQPSSVDKTSIESWHEKLQEIFRHYNCKDIANADETALFFRAVPNETVQMRAEKCTAGCNSSERLTVLLVAFADGKLEIPLVIGKSESPKCFKNLNRDQLPVEWIANNKAWMTRVIFEEFLKKFNKRMEQEKRNILLFVDNALCHPRIQLSNIKLIFFPPCMTSVLQPLDNGIIHNVKLHYRKLLLQHLIANSDGCKTESDLPVRIDVLDAMTFLSCAVKCVTDEFVKRCFQKCGFSFEGVKCCEDVVCNNDYGEMEQLIVEMYKGEVSFGTAQAFVNVDENVSTEFDVTDMESHQVNEINENKGDSDDEHSTEDSEEMETPTPLQVVGYINALKYFAKMNGENELYEKVAELGFCFNSMKKNHKYPK